MQPKDLKPNMIWKAKGSKSGYWVFTGLFNARYPCRVCQIERHNIYEFLYYTNLWELKEDMAQGTFNRFNENDHYGSECVKGWLVKLGECLK